jgi:hypothetical protein
MKICKLRTKKFYKIGSGVNIKKLFSLSRRCGENKLVCLSLTSFVMAMQAFLSGAHHEVTVFSLGLILKY